MYYVSQGDLAIIPSAALVEAGKKKIFTLAEIPSDYATSPIIGEILRPGEEGYLSVTGIQYLFCKVCRVLLTDPESDPLDPSGTLLGSLSGQVNLSEGARDAISTAVLQAKEKIQRDELAERNLLPSERLAEMAVDRYEEDSSTGGATVYINVTNAEGTTFTLFLDGVSVGVE